MKKETIIIIVAIAALAALWYFFIYKKKQTTTPAVSMIAPGEPVAAPVTQAAVVNGPPSMNATAIGASQTLTTVPETTAPSVVSPRPAVQPGVVVPITSSVYDATILPWMNSLGINNKTQALKIYPSMTDAEKASLADIILNVWGGKRPQTPQDTAFWNAWRVKYHVNDGTYSPFAGDAQTAYAGSNDFDSAQDAYVAHDIDPLTPVQNSQQANNFVIKGSGGQAVNSFRGSKKMKK